MASYTKTLSYLQQISATSAVFTYNVDAPDTLSLSIKPEHYGDLPLDIYDRLTVTDGDRVIFSGIVPVGANCAAQAAQGETVSIQLQSDYYVLQNTVYAKLNNNGEVVFSRMPVTTKTTTLSKVVESIDNWLGSYLPSTLRCSVSATIPTPTSNGTSPCASMLTDALRWVPDAMAVQRYSSAGNTLRVVRSRDLDSIELRASENALQNVTLSARHDLQIKTCALVGAVHKVWPASGDVRDLGAFVYAVPIEKDRPDSPQMGGAGDSPASSKMIVKGVKLPERLVYSRDEKEFIFEKYAENSSTQKFIKRFFPELAPLRNVAYAGACFVDVLSKEALQDELEESADEDAQVPNNYADLNEVENWGHSVYVLTEGSFPASTRNSRNVRGLRWCKASLAMVVAVKVKTENITDEQRLLCQAYLPGLRKKKNDGSYYYVRKTLNCILINRRRRVYDPATNKLCSTDEGYNEESSTPPTDDVTTADYIAAMEQYYNAAKVLQHEGTIDMLYNGSLIPSELTGKAVQVMGLRPEWESMNAVIRSVTWTYGQKHLSLTVGPRSVMGFDEMLERRIIAHNRGRDEAQRNALAYDPADEEAQQANESAMSVSPNISAGVDTQSTGRFHKRGTLYLRDEDKVVVCAGGSIRYGNELFHIDDTEEQITASMPNGQPWELGKSVKIKFSKDADGKTVYDLYQK